MSEIIAIVMYLMMTFLAVIGFCVAISLFVGWLFSWCKGDMLSSYYEGFDKPTKTYPEGDYHPKRGYCPVHVVGDK